MPHSCPLCLVNQSVFFCRDNLRSYMHCPECDLVYVPREYHLSSAEEKSHYDTHQNDSADQGYRKFLSAIFKPLSAVLPQGSAGLDFGCGPGPTLSVMFDEAGHHMSLYDRYYYPDKEVLAHQYDFVTATEVIEHLNTPQVVIDGWWQMIKAGGWLGVMTLLRDETTDFSTWFYKNDPTHIAFFSRKSFEWLGARWGVPPRIMGNRIILYQKSV